MQNKYAENAPSCPDRIGRSDMQKIGITSGGIRTFFCADPIQGPAVLNRRPLRKSIFAAPAGRPALQPGKDGAAALGGVKEVDAGDGRNGQLAIVPVVEVKGEGALPELVAAVKTELVDHAKLRGA